MKSWSGANTNKPITDIVEENQVIKFSFMGAVAGILDKQYSNNHTMFTLHLNTHKKEIKVAKITQDCIGGKIRIYSCKGAVVSEYTIDNSTMRLSIADYSAGVYFVSFLTRGGLIHPGKKLSIVN